MNKLSNISARLDEPVLLTEIVKQLADDRFNRRCGPGINHHEWATIQVSSIEVYVSGIVTPESETGYKPVHMPFTSNFLFTCIKEDKKCFRLEWGVCLS